MLRLVGSRASPRVCSGKLMEARLELIEDLVEDFSRKGFHLVGFMHWTQGRERGVGKYKKTG